jgi:hypothetical protein
MVLTFKSSRRYEKILIEREPDGRQRVMRITQSDYNPRHWELREDRPSGGGKFGTFTAMRIQLSSRRFKCSPMGETIIATTKRGEIGRASLPSIQISRSVQRRSLA